MERGVRRYRGRRGVDEDVRCLACDERVEYALY